MTDTDTGRKNRANFEMKLTRLVDETRHDGVAIAGAYDVRTPLRDEPDYTIEIDEVAKHALSRPGET